MLPSSLVCRRSASSIGVNYAFLYITRRTDACCNNRTVRVEGYRGNILLVGPALDVQEVSFVAIVLGLLLDPPDMDEFLTAAGKEKVWTAIDDNKDQLKQREDKSGDVWTSAVPAHGSLTHCRAPVVTRTIRITSKGRDRLLRAPRAPRRYIVLVDG